MYEHVNYQKQGKVSISTEIERHTQRVIARLVNAVKRVSSSKCDHVVLISCKFSVFYNHQILGQIFRDVSWYEVPSEVIWGCIIFPILSIISSTLYSSLHSILPSTLYYPQYSVLSPVLCTLPSILYSPQYSLFSTVLQYSLFSPVPNILPSTLYSPK